MSFNIPDLGDFFTYREALDAGATPDQLRGRRWSKTFFGVRATKPPTTVEELSRAYAPKLRPGRYFSHVTAAVLHGIWLPPELERRMVLDVAVPPGQRPPRDERVHGHLLVERLGTPTVRAGLPIAGLADTWCQLATVLGLEDLIVAGEGVLAKNRRDRISLHELVDAVAEGGRPRQSLLNLAVPELRENVRSAKETEVRRLLVAHGLPEPEINVDVHDRHGMWIKESDLVFRRWKVAGEYEGELHLVDRATQLRDIYLYERMQEDDWRVVRITKDDLRFRRDDVPRRTLAAIEAQKRRGIGSDA